MNIVDEVWRDIPEYEGFYQVSNLGSVRSCDRRVERLAGKHKDRFVSGVTMKASLDSSGYPMVGLSKQSRNKSIAIHRLVALAFLGNKPEGYQVNHIDGNKLNNFVGNLEYCSRTENIRHAFALGLISHKGAKSSFAKLKESDVLVIRERLANGHTQTSIAKDYGVTQANISCIKKGLTWG